jgi:DNA-binding NtrC family response regulator
MRNPFGYKVLIVDDEQNIADSLAIIFHTQDYSTRVAYTAEQAIEIIAESQPDLAIIDVMLPQMNGIDLAIVIQANYPTCRILLFSGQPDSSELAEQAAKKGHTFHIIAKPVHPEFMLELAAHVLAQQAPTPPASRSDLQS